MRQLTTPNIFELGVTYSNDQISYALEIGNSGGIRPKLTNIGKLDFVVLITSAEVNKSSHRNPYADKIEGSILTYTGAGLKGEQIVTGVNKRLLEQVEEPVPVLGFVKTEVNKYMFVGFLFLLRHYVDYQLDSEGKMRRVLMFEFQIISDIKIAIIGKFSEQFRSIYTKFKHDQIVDDTKIIVKPIKNDFGEEDRQLKAIELLKANLMTVNPYEFEVFAGKLISHVGYTNVKVTKKSGDEGVDVSATLKNPISVDLSYSFQVKRWKHSVGRNEVANLRGSIAMNSHGVIIATSHFTEGAIKESISGGKMPINLVGIDALHEVIVSSKFDISDYLKDKI
ncbi:MAG: restriction endonuclease [bacterium]